MRGSTPGLTDSRESHQDTRRHDTILEVLDILLSALIIGPAAIAYWKGTWILMDIYIFNDDLVLSSWVSLVIGLVGHFGFTLLQSPMARVFDPNTQPRTYYFVSRLYTALFGFVCVNAWRGVWNALDLYTGKQVASVVATTVLGVVALAGLRTLRNLSAPPFAVVTDTAEGYFDVATMFHLSKSTSFTMYILDVLFSVLVVGNLVVFVWRGGWVIVDIFLYPNDSTTSAWASLVLGYVVVLVAFFLQPVMKKACDTLQGVLRIVLADIYLLFSFVGTINLWRGVWNLLNVYFLPDNPAASNWLTHFVCLAFLMLINCSNSILVRGVFIDASEEGGHCVVFPCSYLRLFAQRNRDAKRQSKAQHAPSLRKHDAVAVTGNNKQNHVQLQMVPMLTTAPASASASASEETEVALVQ